MAALAVSFDWAYGLLDWQIGEALGISENAVRLIRWELGLKKTGRGRPV